MNIRSHLCLYVSQLTFQYTVGFCKHLDSWVFLWKTINFTLSLKKINQEHKLGLAGATSPQRIHSWRTVCWSYFRLVLDYKYNNLSSLSCHFVWKQTTENEEIHLFFLHFNYLLYLFWFLKAMFSKPFHSKAWMYPNSHSNNKIISNGLFPATK